MYFLYSIEQNLDTSQSNSNIKSETELWSFLKKQHSKKIPVNEFNEDELKCKLSFINYQSSHLNLFQKNIFKISLWQIK